MFRFMTIAVAAAALAASAMSAQACNPLLSKKGATPAIIPSSMLAKNTPNRPGSNSIVGLWHVVHTADDGSLLFESYDMWHSDGTEEEMANGPPAAGVVCFGVWTQSGKTIQLLTHVAFLYDLDNNFVGTLNLTETNKVKSSGNKYTGTIDVKIYDPNGVLVAEQTGTTEADRLN